MECLLHNDETMVVLGVRSSLFLPFKDLGFDYRDEEHENTYKQQDPAPRYHARNAAIVLAGMHGGKTLLGSATPSIDSYFNATAGKYGLVELSTRHGDCLMPEIITADMKELKRKKIMKDTLSPRCWWRRWGYPGPRRAGDPIPKQPGIRPDDRVPRVRVGASLRELRR